MKTTPTLHSRQNSLFLRLLQPVALPGLYALILVVVVLLTGCATPADPRKDSKFQSNAYTTDRPVVRPTRSISSFTDSLMCMDYMLREAQVPTTLITSKQIPDYSSKVPVANKDMIITALSQMSRLSNAFRFVDYEVDIARQDTVQNLTTILLNNNQMQLQRPALYVSGAVAFVDQNVINNRFDAGTSGSRLDTGYSQSRNATVVALELHLGDFRTRTIIPGLDSANEVIIGGAGQGLDLAGRIGNYGVQFNVGRDYAQGTGGAMRTLIDLATIELIGKWARVPYWQCLTLDQTHPDFQRQMRDWFEESGTQVQSSLVQNSLVGRGYLPASSALLPVDSPVLREALGRFQADSGIAVTGVVDFTSYERSLRNFVGLGADGGFTRVGWNEAALRSNAALRDSAGRLKPQGAGGPQANAINIQIKNPAAIGQERPAFEEGEQVFLSATLANSAWLQCYFSDAAGGVMRLLPNPVNPNAITTSNLAVRMPDWMTPNPAFIMDSGKPGVEGVACFASNTDPGERLPEALRGPALKTVAGYSSLEDVNAAFANSLGTEGYVRSGVQWTVVPKRVVPPPAAAATAPAAR